MNRWVYDSVTEGISTGVLPAIALFFIVCVTATYIKGYLVDNVSYFTRKHRENLVKKHIVGRESATTNRNNSRNVR